MLEESALPSIWASMTSWFTPTVLFVLVNLVIGTIAVTSKSHHHRPHPDEEDQQQQQQLQNHRVLSRTPSVLERLRSINLYRFRSGDIPLDTTTLAPPTTTTTTVRAEVVHHPHLDKEEEEEEEEEQQHRVFETLDEAYRAASASSAHDDHQFKRSQSDSHPTAGEMPAKLARKMKKSASTKSAFAHFKEAEIVHHRPATVRVGKVSNSQFFDDEEEAEAAGGGGGVVVGEVDARADDFINRFRKQLQLQRLDSIIRYKEMLNRGK